MSGASSPKTTPRASGSFLPREPVTYAWTFALLLALPFITGALGFAGIGLSVASFTLIYLIAAQGLNLQVGYTGLLNLGAVAFVGLGAYTGAILLSIPGGHTGDVNALAAREAMVVTASSDGRLYAWDLESQAVTRAFKGHSAPVVTLALAGERLASADEDKVARLFELESGAAVARGELPAPPTAMTALGEAAFVGDAYGGISRLEPGEATETGLRAYPATEVARLRSAVVSLQAQADRILAASAKGEVKLLNASGEVQASYDLGATGRSLTAAALSPDGAALLVGVKRGDSYEGQLYELADGGAERVLTLSGHSRAIEAVAFSADGARLLLGSQDRTASLWDRAGQQLATFKGHLGAIRDVGFAGERILTCSTDRTARAWEVEGAVTELPVARSALVAFYTRLMPKLEGHSRWLLFVIDPNFLAYMSLIPVVLLAAMLLGLAIGVPTLRLRGDYFAIVTLGLAEILRLVVRNEDWLTNGPAGIKDLPPVVSFAEGPDAITFFRQSSHYFLGLAFFAFSLLLMVRVRDSRMGRAFMAIRDDELAAQSNGIHVSAYKVYSFLIAACITALAGVAQLARLQFVSPNDLLFMESVLYLCCIVLGGLGSVRGALIGGIVIGSLGEVMRLVIAQFEGVPAQVRYIVFGVALILVMRYKPEGLSPAADEETERGDREKSQHRDTSASLFSFGEA